MYLGRGIGVKILNEGEEETVGNPYALESIPEGGSIDRVKSSLQVDVGHGQRLTELMMQLRTLQTRCPQKTWTCLICHEQPTQNLEAELNAKLAIYRTCIIPVLLYGSETWTLLKSDLNRLELFHMRCKHSILGIQWFYFVNNYEVTQRTCLPPINHLFQRRHTAFFGHVARLADNIPA